MKDLVRCPLCSAVRIDLGGPHSPRFVLNAAGVRELRDCAGNVIPAKENAEPVSAGPALEAVHPNDEEGMPNDRT